MPNTLRERFDEKFGDWTLGFDEIVEFLEQEISLVRQEALKEGEERMKQKCLECIPQRICTTSLEGEALGFNSARTRIQTLISQL